MAKIFYGISGEGRGHAARALALLSHLKQEHEIRVYAAGHAYPLLQHLHDPDGPIHVRRVAAMEFKYDEARRLDYVRSFQAGLPFLFDLSHLVASVEHDMALEAPDLVITDFEPLLPRAARRLGIPFISMDHQHFLLSSDFSELPPALRGYAAIMGTFVLAFYQGQVSTVVSSFFQAPLKWPFLDTIQVGVLLRSAILDAQPEVQRHVVAYLRRESALEALAPLAECGREVRVYGLGEQPSRGRLNFCQTHPTKFVEDLATADCLISTAGNQLIGEALFLEKPVLAFPEPGNYEQHMNAFYLDRTPGGRSCDLDTLTASQIRDFLEDTGSLRQRIDRDAVVGNRRALAAIEAHLPLPFNAAVSRGWDKLRGVAPAIRPSIA